DADARLALVLDRAHVAVAAAGSVGLLLVGGARAAGPGAVIREVAVRDRGAAHGRRRLELAVARAAVTVQVVAVVALLAAAVRLHDPVAARAGGADAVTGGAVTVYLADVVRQVTRRTVVDHHVGRASAARAGAGLLDVAHVVRRAAYLSRALERARHRAAAAAVALLGALDRSVPAARLDRERDGDGLRRVHHARLRDADVA